MSAIHIVRPLLHLYLLTILSRFMYETHSWPSIALIMIHARSE